jgi:hypothetical protein
MLGGFNVIAGIIGSFLIGWAYLLIFKKILKKKAENIEVSNKSNS